MFRGDGVRLAWSEKRYMREKLQVLFGSEGKLRDVSFWYVDPRMAEPCKVVVAVSETSDMSRDVSFSCCYRGKEACAY